MVAFFQIWFSLWNPCVACMYLYQMWNKCWLVDSLVGLAVHQILWPKSVTTFDFTFDCIALLVWHGDVAQKCSLAWHAHNARYIAWNCDWFPDHSHKGLVALFILENGQKVVSCLLTERKSKQSKPIYNAKVNTRQKFPFSTFSWCVVDLRLAVSTLVHTYLLPWSTPCLLIVFSR